MVESKETYKPYGERPTGYYGFTKGGRFFNGTFGSERKAPAGASPTDAERAELLILAAAALIKYLFFR